MAIDYGIPAEGVQGTPPQAEVGARPVKSPEVADVQRRLKALGYPVGPVDGRLGPKTKAAINAYLSERGLPATGWITPNLISEVEMAGKPPPPSPRPDSAAMVHSVQRDLDPAKVIIVQRRLTELGFYRGPVDGLVGPRLSDAVMAYQKSTNMPVTGWIFPDLIADLSAPPKVEEAVTPPPPPPVIPTWVPRSVIGKSLHARPGDLLGVVADIVLGSDGGAVGVLTLTSDLYGNSKRNTLIAWADVAPWAGRAAIILPMTADQLKVLRRDPPPFRLAADQMLTSRLLGARVVGAGKEVGEVSDAVFEQDGKLVTLKIQGDDTAELRDVPASQVILKPADDAVEIQDGPVVERFQSGAS